MSPKVKNLYEFGEFRLDTVEHILSRGSKSVELTPKGFELLCVLVENHGRLLTKDELMEKVWADSFVEEGNLTFNIRQLRIVLDDDAHEPRYIKTVRRHGYRFIADVRKIVEESNPQFNEIKAAETSTEKAPTENADAAKTNKSRTAVLLIALVFLALNLAFGIWYARSGFRQNAAVLTSPFESEKFSSNGKVKFAALSPDGKNLVYTNRSANGTEAIWLRRMESGENVEILPPAEANHYDLEFSPDGNTVYFSLAPWRKEEQSGIYRLSIFGGVPQKLVGEIFGRVGISPDGTHMTYNRCPRREDEYCSLWIADTDGKNERKLITRASGLYIGDSDFSPDGKRLAFTVGQARNKANEFGIWTLDFETGAESEFTLEKFYVITSVAWLPDSSGLLFSAFRFPDNNFRIWQAAANGEARALTNVSEHYQFLSIDKEARRIAAIQVKESYQVLIVDLNNPSDIRFLADGGSAALAPDGKVYFSSTMSGNHEIWSINTNGSNRRQLTNSKDEEYYPVASPDGGSIYFASTRTGAAQIWRMKTDGTELAQVTFKAGGFPLSITNNGEWLYYMHGVDRTLWRVSLSNGEEQIVLNKQNWLGFGIVQNWLGFGVSPDGTLAAYPEKQGEETVLTVARIPGGQPVKTFRLPDKKMSLQQIGWLPDGTGMLYLSNDQKFENVILWKQPLNETAPRRIVNLGKFEVSGYNLPVSPDGKTFAAVQQEILSDVVLLKGLR